MKNKEEKQNLHDKNEKIPSLLSAQAEGENADL